MLPVEPCPNPSDPLNRSWETVLQRITDAVLVMDRDRNLRFVNHPARQLLGYEPGETLAGRCRLLTRGLDCEATCPVTFALQQGLEVVDDFESLYQNRDGDPVPVRVTAVPLLGPDGALLGHLEILRPSEPSPGFILAGRSHRALELRRRVGEAARSGRHLVVVGERPACLNVALTVHRLGGLATQLFYHWQHTGLAELPTPPGTLFVDGEDWAGLCASAPPGLRIVAAVPRQPRVEIALPVEVIELPALGERREDLPLIIAAWVDELAPGLRVAPGALRAPVRARGGAGDGRSCRRSWPSPWARPGTGWTRSTSRRGPTPPSCSSSCWGSATRSPPWRTGCCGKCSSAAGGGCRRRRTGSAFPASPSGASSGSTGSRSRNAALGRLPRAAFLTPPGPW